NPLFTERWSATLNEGSMAGREDIFATAAEMILEKPVLGWGFPRFFYQLGARLNVPARDPHNLFLALLGDCGIVGTIPFLLGLWFCGKSAWNARLGNLQLLPLALLFTVIGAGGSGNTSVWKTQWLLFALILAAGRASPKSSKQQDCSFIHYRNVST